MNNDIKSIIARLANVEEKSIISIFPYGSRVYGTNNENSDYDYQVVCENYCDHVAGQQYDTKDGTFSFHTHVKHFWEDHLKSHKIFALESVFQDPKFKMHINHSLLRQEISSRSSNSWVRCKKKLTVESDQYSTAIKSLFHSFRIPMFGIQLATHNRIVDYREANHLWYNEIKPLLYENKSWDYIYDTFKGRHNKLMTDFRKVAEK